MIILGLLGPTAPEHGAKAPVRLCTSTGAGCSVAAKTLPCASKNGWPRAAWDVARRWPSARIPASSRAAKALVAPATEQGATKTPAVAVIGEEARGVECISHPAQRSSCDHPEHCCYPHARLEVVVPTLRRVEERVCLNNCCEGRLAVPQGHARCSLCAAARKACHQRDEFENRLHSSAKAIKQDTVLCHLRAPVPDHVPREERYSRRDHGTECVSSHETARGHNNNDAKEGPPPLGILLLDDARWRLTLCWCVQRHEHAALG
mmetsp:Transcript_14212/g.33403  ORF Transcript_14212/g.33403 Transcript_14212/m.33403 type:complete len:263 (-) Transcript_14212:63-851(-)